jgi:hypothetical protein
LYFGITTENYLRWFATTKDSRLPCKPEKEKDSQLNVGVWQHVAVSYNYTNGRYAVIAGVIYKNTFEKTNPVYHARNSQ